MEIEVDITIRLTEDWCEHSFYTENGYTPTVKDIVHRAIEDIDGSLRFGVSYQAKNVVISDLDCEEQTTDENIQIHIETDEEYGRRVSQILESEEQ